MDLEFRPLTDEELAWQLAREMEAEELAREQQDAEYALQLQAELNARHETHSMQSHAPEMPYVPYIPQAPRPEEPIYESTPKVATCESTLSALKRLFLGSIS